MAGAFEAAPTLDFQALEDGEGYAPPARKGANTCVGILTIPPISA